MGPTIMDENMKKLIAESIASAIKESFSEVNRSLAEMTKSLKNLSNSISESHQLLSGGEVCVSHRQNHVNNKIPSLQFNSMASVKVHELVSDEVVIKSGNELKDVKTEDAYKVFDEMSSIKNIKQEGTIQEYFDSFSFLFNKEALDEMCAVSLFIFGLRPEIKNGVSMFKPKTLTDAYSLAKVQESINSVIKDKTNSPLFSNPKLEDLSEVYDDKLRLCKEYNGSGEIGLMGSKNDVIFDFELDTVHLDNEFLSALLQDKQEEHSGEMVEKEGRIEISCGNENDVHDMLNGMLGVGVDTILLS